MGRSNTRHGHGDRHCIGYAFHVFLPSERGGRYGRPFSLILAIPTFVLTAVVMTPLAIIGAAGTGRSRGSCSANGRAALALASRRTAGAEGRG